MADFERSLIVERTSAGRIAARARGVRLGPTPTLDAGRIVHLRWMGIDQPAIMMKNQVSDI
jgi:DNA invertase Pin-like site-specific DNA recombinase